MNLNLIDVIVGMFIMIEIIQGIARGFVSSAFGIVNIIISMYFAHKYAVNVSNWMIKIGLYNSLNKSIAGSAGNNVQTVDYIMQIFNIKKPDVTLVFINMASFLLIFVGLMVLLNFIRVLLIPSIRKSRLNYVDKFGGALFGGIKAILTIALLCAIILPFTSIMPGNSEFRHEFFSSGIISYILKNNFIMNIFKVI